MKWPLKTRVKLEHVPTVMSKFDRAQPSWLASFHVRGRKKEEVRFKALCARRGLESVVSCLVAFFPVAHVRQDVSFAKTSRPRWPASYHRTQYPLSSPSARAVIDHDQVKPLGSTRNRTETHSFYGVLIHDKTAF